MGLFSKIKDVVNKIDIDKIDGVTNKIDTVTNVVSSIPAIVDGLGELKKKVEELHHDYEMKSLNRTKSKLDEFGASIARIDARNKASEYECLIKTYDEQKMKIEYAISPQYEDMAHVGENLFAVKSNNKWGIIDVDSRIVVPFEYEYIFARNYYGDDDYIFPAKKSGKWGYISLKNEVAIDFKYLDSGNFKWGMAPAAILTGNDEVLYGYINKNGEFVIAPTYEIAGPFNEYHCAIIGKYDVIGNPQYGVINEAGRIIIGCKTKNNIHFEDDYMFTCDELYGATFFDYNGAPIEPTEEMKQNAEEYEGSENELWQSTVYRKNKKIKNKIIPYFNRELKFGYFIKNEEGMFSKIEPVFDEAYYQNEFGYARVKYNGLYGVIKLQ